VEQAERLIFLNKNKKLNVKIIPEKDKYMPREEVVATIQVTDEFGNPTSADLFVSAVNDQLLSFADDKSGNLISKMLLESELQEKVEEPKFYFDPKEPKADKALDYLMMTSGWRRFTWGKVLAESQTNLYHQGELAVVSGVVRDAYTGKPVANANIKFTSNGNVFKTDNNGRFIFNKLDLYEPQAMVFSGENYSPSNQSVYYYNQNLNISLVPTNYKYPKSGGLNIKSSSVLDDFDVIAPMEQNLAAPEMERSVNVVQMKHDKSSEKRMEKKEPPKFQAPQAPPVDKVPSKDQNGKSANGKVFMDERFMPQGPVPMQKKKVHGNVGLNKNSQSAALYRAREFQTPKYSPSETPELRDDFRSTVFWKPNLKIDESGKGKIRFSTSDEITSFRLTAGGISGNGLVGQDETLIYNQLPFTLATKVPVEVTTGDKISIPVTIKNNTLKPISGVLKVKGPQGFLAIGNLPEYQQIPAGKAKTIYLNYDVLQEAEMGDLSLTFVSCGMNEGVKQKVNVVKAGYPVAQSFNGNKLSEEFHLDLRKAIKGSLKVKLSAFPSVVGDIMSGLSGILREPSGCFEQTSMSSWPNTMVLDYTKTMEVKDKELENRAAELLKKGYSRLVTFETPNKGYEWFGKAPAHEGLTAYGLLQFSDMSKAGADIDKQMMDRTTSWLLAQRDNEGGFQRNSKAYHAFGQIAPEIMNGYIVYALSETGMKDMKKEVDKAFKLALDNKDPYQLAMVSIALGNLGDNARAEKALEELKSQQKEDGSFPGKIHSITHSTGVSLSIETTALSVLALIKNNQRGTELNKAIKFISSSRNSYGTFGNTQGTVLALKALTEYAKASKATKEGGTVEVYVNGKKVDEVSYKAGDQGPLEINNLEKHLKEEKEKVTVKFKNTQNPLPVTLSVEYATNDPESSNECKVGLDVKVLDHSVNQGETVRLKAVVTNREKTDLPSTMVLIGLPAGLSAQPWQLKELQEKNVFDYYEIIGNKLALYYRGMAPSGKQEINLDLKAEVPGVYEAPASSAYLYYTNEFKTWTNYGKITVNKSN
jgi:alpha-2-macroglobulin-like protein